MVQEVKHYGYSFVERKKVPIYNGRYRKNKNGTYLYIGQGPKGEAVSVIVAADKRF